MNSSSERRDGLLKVGLTGGIACGKSNVLRTFEALGTHTIDADKIARDVVEPGTPAYREIIRAFGEQVLRRDGSLDRKVLGTRVFSDERERHKLNEIVHPHILEREDELIRRCDPGRSRIVVIDAALMVEVGTYRRYDVVVVAFCPPEVQLHRLIRRDGLPGEEARRRIRSQLPIYQKLLAADFAVDTSGSIENTREQVEQVYRELGLYLAALD